MSAKLNAIQCLTCFDIIESVHVHDFVRCTCGNVFVDGGLDYCRRGYNTELPAEDAYIELGQWENKRA